MELSVGRATVLRGKTDWVPAPRKKMTASPAAHLFWSYLFQRGDKKVPTWVTGNWALEVTPSCSHVSAWLLLWSWLFPLGHSVQCAVGIDENSDLMDSPRCSCNRVYFYTWAFNNKVCSRGLLVHNHFTMMAFWMDGVGSWGTAHRSQEEGVPWHTRSIGCPCSTVDQFSLFWIRWFTRERQIRESQGWGSDSIFDCKRHPPISFHDFYLLPCREW